MNPDYVQTIPMPAILSKLGLQPVKKDKTCYRYNSPFHNEVTPTLTVSIADNTWSDTHNRSSGGSLLFVQSWLLHQGLHCTEADALHWLKFNIGYPKMTETFGLQKAVATDQYIIAFKTLLQEKSLIRYVLQKGFSYAEAKRLFKQVYVENKSTGKEFRALGMRNEEGGCAIYNPHIETMIGPVSVSFIRGSHNNYERVYVFRTAFEYSRALQLYPAIASHDSIILHAYGCADHAAGYIRGFGYQRLYTVFDNSGEGKQATKAFHWLCNTEMHLKHCSLQLHL